MVTTWHRNNWYERRIKLNLIEIQGVCSLREHPKIITTGGETGDGGFDDGGGVGEGGS